jgi:tRNA G37 N-methylase TrmD
MAKFAIIEEAKRTARMCFVGIAIPHQPSLADGVVGPIRSEKILKFNRKALRNMGKSKKEKVDPRYGGGEDNMILKVGKPGSWDRVEALRSQYEAIQVSGEEISPFRGED